MQILKFYADWCGPCKTLTRVIEEAGITTEIVPIDIDANNIMAQKYGVRGIPMLIMIDSSGNEIKRKSGMMTEAQLKQFIGE